MAVEKQMTPADFDIEETDEVEIQVVNPEAVSIESDGEEVIIDFTGEFTEELVGPDHDANLAEYIEDDELGALASELVDDFVILTSQFLVVIDHTTFNIRWMEKTTDLMMPTRDHPNPVVEMNCMRLLMCDDEQKIIEFPDEASALAAQALFEDMFFSLFEQDASQID